MKERYARHGNHITLQGTRNLHDGEVAEITDNAVEEESESSSSDDDEELRNIVSKGERSMKKMKASIAKGGVTSEVSKAIRKKGDKRKKTAAGEYICEVCEKTFKHFEPLRVHERRHLGMLNIEISLEPLKCLQRPRKRGSLSSANIVECDLFLQMFFVFMSELIYVCSILNMRFGI